MSFWINDINTEKTTGSFELGGFLEPIPTNTNVTAFIEEAKWDSYEGNEYINLKWKVLAPAEYKNRIIFQKVKVLEPDENKAKKAQTMLLSINHNAKGKIHESAKMPDTGELQKNLCNKPMIINLQLWELEDGRKGNWVAAVKPKNAEDPENVVNVEVVKAAPAPKKTKMVEVEVDEDELQF